MKRLIYLLMLVFSTLPAFINALECYEVRESNTGIGLLHTEGLDNQACYLLNVMDGYDFSVVGYDFYPVMAFASQTDRFNTLFKNAIAELDNEKESYGVVTKAHNTDGTITYRTHIKFPTTGKFANLTPFEKEGINQLFLNEIEKLVDADFDVGNNEPSWPEEGGWITLASLFGDVLDESLDLGQDLMQLANFESTSIDPSETFSRPNDGGDGSAYNPPAHTNNVVYDFTGLQVSGHGLKEKISVDIDPESPENEDLRPFTAMANLSHAYIITDNNNTPEELSSASDQFRDSDKKIVIWMHFDLNAVETQETTDSVYVRYGDNLTIADAEAVINEMFEYYMRKWVPTLNETVDGYNRNGDALTRNNPHNDCNGNPTTCDLNWRWGGTCLLPTVGVSGEWVMGSEFAVGLAIGLFDGLLGTVQVFFEAGKGLVDIQVGWWRSIINYTKELVQTAIAKRSLIAVFDKVLNDTAKVIKAAWNTIVNVYKTLRGMISNLTWNTVRAIIDNVWIGIVTWMGDLLDGDKCPAYDIGVLLFDVLLTVFTGGTAAGSTFLPKMLKWVKKLSSKPQEMIAGLFKKVDDGIAAAANNPSTRAFAEEAANKISWCNILGRGCFVAGTPVFMSRSASQFSIKDSMKMMAMAATMPIVALPIEEVQLLDYAVAHTSVNSAHTLTANSDHKTTYLGLLNDDPYNSDNQRARDQYRLDNENWHEVIFQQVGGLSVAKLALHKDWIDNRQYDIGAIVQMDLPEQGISGPFKITSIEHILPQKKPADEDPADDYDYRPVTGIFTHVSSDIHHISFNNEESLDVTYRHPIYSLTAEDWVLAGRLKIGESVLTKSGQLFVTSNTASKRVETVYNLEVKDLHNFLVGESGIVVHNAYKLRDLLLALQKKLDDITANPGGGINRGLVAKKIPSRQSHKVAGHELGVKKKDLDKFADAVRDKDWEKLRDQGFEVTPFGDTQQMMITKAGNKTTRYRTPVQKGNGKIQSNIEKKDPHVTWDEVDAWKQTNQVQPPPSGYKDVHPDIDEL